MVVENKKIPRFEYFFIFRLFFPNDRKYLSEKNRYKSDNDKKKYFSLGIKKYSSNTKECGKKVDCQSDFLFRKTDFHKTKV